MGELPAFFSTASTFIIWLVLATLDKVTVRMKRSFKIHLLVSIENVSNVATGRYGS